MISNFLFSYNTSIRVQNIRNRIWPKRPTLRLRLAKTSYFTPSAGQNVLLYAFGWPKRPTLRLRLAKTSVAKTSWPKRPWQKRHTFESAIGQFCACSMIILPADRVAYFRLSPLLKHVRKVVGGCGKKVVLVLV